MICNPGGSVKRKIPNLKREISIRVTRSDRSFGRGGEEDEGKQYLRRVVFGRAHDGERLRQHALEGGVRVQVHGRHEAGLGWVSVNLKMRSAR